MPNYHLTAKGEDFLDQFEELGTGQVEADLVDIYGWFYWIRESPGSHQLEVFKDKVGEEKAMKALDWAVRKGYLEKDPETGTPDPTFGQTTTGFDLKDPTDTLYALKQRLLKKGIGFLPRTDPTGPYDVQAVSKGWAETTRGKVREQTYDRISKVKRNLARKLAIAKESGDYTEYSRILDEIVEMDRRG